MENFDPFVILAFAIPILFAITVHEVAHGWVAFQYGDPTAYQQGRLTLNPIKHIDPIGTLLVPTLMVLLGGIIFGWAKPVPVDHRRLRDPKRSMVLVAAAGPASNLIMAFLWGVILKSADVWADDSVAFFQMMAFNGIWINIILMVLNLLPIPPLDGSHIVKQLLPPAYQRKYDQVIPYGFFILIALAFSGILFAILFPMCRFVFNAITSLLDIPITL